MRKSFVILVPEFILLFLNYNLRFQFHTFGIIITFNTGFKKQKTHIQRKVKSRVKCQLQELSV